MGAVRVKVKLTNAIDKKLAERGLLNPNLVRVYEALALVDTGASRLIIPQDVLQHLGIRILGQQIATYADGRQEVLGLTEDVLVEVEGLTTPQLSLVTGNEVLIGQAVLEELDLLVDCKRERLILYRESFDESV